MKSIFVIIFYWAIVNVVIATDSVIWRQEFNCDFNSTCRPGAIMVDSGSNELIILGTSEQIGTRKTDFWLWKIDPNGNVTHQKSLGPVSKYNLMMVQSFGIRAATKLNTGDVVELRLDDTNSASLSVTDKDMQSRSVNLKNKAQKWSEKTLLDMVSCSNDNFIFVGQDHDSNGIVMRTDMAGNIVWEKIFDHRQTEILSSVACDTNSGVFYVVGISVSTFGKMAFADATTVCILLYDSNGELKASDFFEGGFSPWPSSLPKVICLRSGDVIVVYDKSKNGKPKELYAKTYTRELKPLGEKQILQTEGPPPSFDICVIPEDRFVFAAVVNYKDLRVYECKADSTILQALELNGEVGARGVYVNYLAGKIFVASTTRLKENEKEAKIQLLAIKPYKTN